MKFTDLYIQRPVLASVISLLILVVGLRSITSLDVRQYPETQDTVVTVSTSYPGASSELIKGFITTPLQQAIAEAQGIDYLSSSSTPGPVGDRGPYAAELSAQRGRGRDPGQGCQPPQRAAGRCAGPGDLLAHRRCHGADVPRVLQRADEGLADQRLPAAGGAAQAAGPAGGREGRPDRRQDVRHAGLAGPAAHGRTRCHGAGRGRRAARQQLPVRDRAGARRIQRDRPVGDHRCRRRGGLPQSRGAPQRRFPGAPA